MSPLFSDAIIERIAQAAAVYYRLILLVGPAGSGKTTTLQDVHERTSAPLINVNLALSRRLLDIAERQRPTHIRRIFSEIVESADTDIILLDNLEITFDIALRQEPLRLLQGLSRNKTVVAAWNGEIRADRRRHAGDTNPDYSSLMTESSSLSLVYALPGHPEYRKYPVKDFLYVIASKNQG